MPRDAKRMKPELMWAAVRPDGQMVTFPLWNRKIAAGARDHSPGCRIVRVRVTQYKPKPRKRHAP